MWNEVTNLEVVELLASLIFHGFGGQHLRFVIIENSHKKVFFHRVWLSLKHSIRAITFDKVKRWIVALLSMLRCCELGKLSQEMLLIELYSWYFPHAIVDKSILTDFISWQKLNFQKRWTQNNVQNDRWFHKQLCEFMLRSAGSQKLAKFP
jgi:hypothetical protein